MRKATCKIIIPKNLTVLKNTCDSVMPDLEGILGVILEEQFGKSCDEKTGPQKKSILSEYLIAHRSNSGLKTYYLPRLNPPSIGEALSVSKQFQAAIVRNRNTNSNEALMFLSGNVIVHAKFSAPDEELQSLLLTLSEKFIFLHDFKTIYGPLVKRFGKKILPWKYKDTMASGLLLSVGSHGVVTNMDCEYLKNTYMKVRDIPEELRIPATKPEDEAIQRAFLLPHLSRILSAEINKLNGSTVSLEIENAFIANLITIEASGIPVNHPYLKSEQDRLLLELQELEALLCSTPDGTSDTEIKIRNLKLEIAFFEPYLDSSNGRVYPSFNANSCASGRISTCEPNVQGIRREYAKNFYLAPKGKAIISVDIPASQIKVAAVIAMDEILIAAFKSGKDLHRHTAAKIYGKSEEEVTDIERQVGKTANFQLLFGTGAESFKNTLEKATVMEFSLPEVKSIMESFFQAYPGLSAWQTETKKRISEASSNFIHVTTIHGRKIRVHEYTKALNYAIAGSEAEIIKNAVNLFAYECREQGVDAQVINLVHDSIVVETDIDDKEKASRLLKESLELAINTALKLFTTKVDVVTLSETPNPSTESQAEPIIIIQENKK